MILKNYTSDVPASTTIVRILPRIWGRNEDGSPYIRGITVAELREQLSKYADTDEVCMVVTPKKYANGGGLLGKLKSLERGSDGQMWLQGGVIDESLE
jgi:hypothetical protein